MIYFLNPGLVDQKRANDESGADLGRLSNLPYGFTAFYWYSRFPNHYAGDGSQFSKRLGELLIQKESSQLTELIRYLKSNNTVEQLQEEYFKKAQDPLK